MNFPTKILMMIKNHKKLSFQRLKLRFVSQIVYQMKRELLFSFSNSLIICGPSWA